MRSLGLTCRQRRCQRKYVDEEQIIYLCRSYRFVGVTGLAYDTLIEIDLVARRPGLSPPITSACSRLSPKQSDDT
jgi:hypothetical protein